jgi:signal transduction histidine kinase
MPTTHYSPISRKLTWVLMLVSAVVLLVACLSFFVYDFYTFKVGVTRNLSVQGNIIASNTTSALAFDDVRAAEITLSALKNSPRIFYAGIFKPDGHLFADYRRSPDVRQQPLPSLPPGGTQIHWLGDPQVVSVDSIELDGKVVGFVSLRSDLQSLTDRIKGFAAITVAIFLLCVVTVLLLSRGAQHVITQPVVRLAETVRIVSRERNYSIRAAMTSGSEDELTVLVSAFNEMLAEIQQRDTALLQAHDELEQKVLERTAQLATANKELEAFSYSVSHDLRAPLRSIDGFSLALLEDCSDSLNSVGKQHLQRIRAAAQRMSTLIDELLNLARVARSEIRWGAVDLSTLSRSIAEELKTTEPGRDVRFLIADGAVVKGDSELLRVAMENMLNNAWKYTSAHSTARIEFGWSQQDGKTVYFVRDDGAGFDPRYASRLFGAFQRLHSIQEFSGTGIGLATVQRIIHRHGGEIWAEGAVEKGATFYFIL